MSNYDYKSGDEVEFCLNNIWHTGMFQSYVPTTEGHDLNIFFHPSEEMYRVSPENVRKIK